MDEFFASTLGKRAEEPELPAPRIPSSEDTGKKRKSKPSPYVPEMENFWDIQREAIQGYLIYHFQQTGSLSRAQCRGAQDTRVAACTNKKDNESGRGRQGENLKLVSFLFFQMISADAPVVFSKACELFIADLTMRAWVAAFHLNIPSVFQAITVANKRKTLQARHPHHNRLHTATAKRCMRGHR